MTTTFADDKLKTFALGGNAVFTIQGKETRYTFKIRRPEEDKPYFVSLLTGPDNTADYTYIGILNPETGFVYLTAKSKMNNESKPVVALRWILERVWKGTSVAPATVYHEGRCGRCGRALTVPESIESGFGPECITRVAA